MAETAQVPPILPTSNPDVTAAPAVPERTPPRRPNILILVIAMIGLIIVSFGIVTYLLSTTEVKEEINQGTPTNTPSPTQTPTINQTVNPFADFKYSVPQGWNASTELGPVNNSITFTDASNARKITVYKHYSASTAGLKYSEQKAFAIAGKSVTKIYYLEDLPTPATVSMFVSYGQDPNDYLIISNWEVKDVAAEDEIDKILTSFKFAE